MGRLLRDKVPETIRRNGEKPIIRRLGKDEFASALGYTAVEKAWEFAEAETTEDRMSSLADLLEVVRVSVVALGGTMDDLEKIRLAEAEEHGGFESRMYWEGNE